MELFCTKSLAAAFIGAISFIAVDWLGTGWIGSAKPETICNDFCEIRHWLLVTGLAEVAGNQAVKNWSRSGSTANVFSCLDRLSLPQELDLCGLAGDVLRDVTGLYAVATKDDASEFGKGMCPLKA